jgi:hypothetical protein
MKTVPGGGYQTENGINFFTVFALCRRDCFSESFSNSSLCSLLNLLPQFRLRFQGKRHFGVLFIKEKSYAQRRFISPPFKCAKVGCWFWLENLGHRRSLYHLAKRGNILISPRLHGSKLFVSIRSLVKLSQLLDGNVCSHEFLTSHNNPWVAEPTDGARISEK